VSERVDPRPNGARGLDRDDLGGVLPNGFYASSPAAAPDADPVQSKRDGKPSHYKVICISMYTEDLKRLDTMVEALKARGLTKANRSALIRYALAEVDLDRVPKGL
jgi:hypothetical protein